MKVYFGVILLVALAILLFGFIPPLVSSDSWTLFIMGVALLIGTPVLAWKLLKRIMDLVDAKS